MSPTTTSGLKLSSWFFKFEISIPDSEGVQLLNSEKFFLPLYQKPTTNRSPSTLIDTRARSLEIDTKPNVPEIDEKTKEKIGNQNLLERLRKGAKEQEYWCSISYYEFNERVGEIWHASKDMPTIHIDG